MTDVDFHDPTRPTRYVRPEEYDVGTHMVAGCPECFSTGSVRMDVRARRRWRFWRRRFVSVTVRCRYCQGHGTVRWDRNPDGVSFTPNAR